MTRALRNHLGVFIELDLDESGQWVYARWIGQISAEDAKVGAMAVLKMIEKSQCRLLLNDNRDVLGHWSEANDWIARVWIPRAMDLGLEKFAHILSHYSYGQLSAEEMRQNVGEAFAMHLFKDMESARAWLLGDSEDRGK